MVPTFFVEGMKFRRMLRPAPLVRPNNRLSAAFLTADEAFITVRACEKASDTPKPLID